MRKSFKHQKSGRYSGGGDPKDGSADSGSKRASTGVCGSLSGWGETERGGGGLEEHWDGFDRSDHRSDQVIPLIAIIGLPSVPFIPVESVRIWYGPCSRPFRVTLGLGGRTPGVSGGGATTSRSPVSMAALSFFFHCSATSFARGSSGLGALNNAWIDSNTVRICRAGDHLSGRREGQQQQEGGRGHTDLWGRSYLSKCLNIFFPVCRRWGGRFWSWIALWELPWGTLLEETVQV